MKNIIIFASGNGTNAERIINYFKNDENIDVVAVFTNNPNAGVIKRANSLFVNVVVFNRYDFYNTNNVLDAAEGYNADLIVLAGFLWLVPDNFIGEYKNKVINIHPALLPKYGGKGMYGMRVHEAVIEANEKKSGITIHLADGKYDEGKVLFQAEVEIESGETPQSLAEKIHTLEYDNFPIVIEKLLT